MSFRLRSATTSGGGAGVADAKKLRLEIFESIGSGTSGTVTKPTGSTIRLNEYGAGTDAQLAKISSSYPVPQNVVDGSGVILATTFDTSGAWVLSGTPAAYPFALCYVVEVAIEDYDDTSANIISVRPAGFSSTSIADGSVSDTEFKYINTLSSNAQTQLTALADMNVPGYFYADTPNGYGSTNVVIPRMTNVRADTGNGIWWTYTDSATLGNYITILKAGRFGAIFQVTNPSQAIYLGVSVNTSVNLTTVAGTIRDVTWAQGQRAVALYSATRGGPAPAFFDLAVNDVVRFHSDGQVVYPATNCYFNFFKC